MTDRKQDEAGGTSSDLQESQYGGGSGRDRGERFDEAQGGGRSWEEVSPSADEELGAHQDRGQSEADAEFNAESE
ncbi:MAG: hypothetical protein QOH04_2380 [Sphingomonadales bacterium]|jgi:hypothetical protein|nr:hypothetical protein [Sphingomonadales bacterium]MEA3036608.1 hypothetical protein [Sphingomonadales bacterium]